MAEKLLKLHRRTLAKPHLKAGELGRVKTEPVAEKDTRTTIHQTLRRVFQGRLESSTENDNTLIISAVPARRLKQQTKRGGDGSVVVDNRRGKLGWSEVGGEFLHFTIYKENKDTMEVINFLGRQMKLGVKGFKFAGTKDRRGVTVQRASLFRVDAARLAGMNRSLRNAVVGDFEYQPQGLELGDLCGNEFVITLRDCQFPVDLGSDPVMAATDLVSVAIRNLREKGYFNYYGLQRFGTFATRTDTVGVKMLQGDFKGACESILHYTAASLAAAQGQNATNGNSKVMLSSDDIARAEAIHIFQTTGNAARALEKLPRRFSAEANIIRHLGRKQNDYVGALQTIPRNLRLMYVHAYQSLVWNFALGERWRLYGDKVVEGDLVLVNEFKEQDGETSTGAHRVGEDVDTTVDADGEAIILPDSTGDGAVSADSVFERARALTAEEAASGRYGIFDIVLPLPGYDIIYPPNAVGEFYKSFMASERGGGLDPYDMRRKWKDVSLSGGYRKMMSRMGEKYMFEVRKYTDDNEQFVKTDLDRLRRREKKNAGKGEGVKGQEGEKDSDEDSSSDEMEEVTQEDNKEGEKDAEMEDENEAGEEEEEEDKLAVIIKFQLGASQYATMALRELMKTGGTKEYKPEYLGGR